MEGEPVVAEMPPWHSEPMLKHHGSIQELQDAVAQIGYEGDWAEKPNGIYKFTAKDKAGLNWSSTKGTIWFDGPKNEKENLEAAITAFLTGEAPAEAPKGGTVFVVHGHDDEAREQLELILHRLGLEPYVLQNTGGGGLTIIENLEKMIGKNAESSFGIVLLTPDDMGYSKEAGETEVKPRARQNVVLEMGMLLASLTRPRVAVLQRGFVEPPSDVAGIVYLPFNDHVKETVPKLVGRLEEAGFKIDASAITRASQ